MPPERSRTLLRSALGLLGLAVLAGLIACGANGTRESVEVPAANAVLRPDYRGLRDDLADLIARVRERYHLHGLSLALVDGTELVWAEGFGEADRRRGRVAGPDTVYRVGSIAKPFTAAAVMQLADRDLLDIDQPLFAYLPEFSIRSRFNRTAQPITVRSVLFHHAGLPTDYSKGMWSDMEFTHVAALLGEEYTAFPPNLVFSYSNVGYTLLGHMVQDLAGEPFPRYMTESFFQPLGMDHTGYALDPAWDLAVGYDRHGRAAAQLPIRDLPAFGLYASARDLARFMGMMLDGGRLNGRQVLASATLEEMLEVQNADVPLDLNVLNGLGWFIERDTIMGAGYVARHGGTTLDYASEMILLPEQRLGVAVLSNTAGSRRVVSHLAEEVLRRVLESREGLRPPPTGDFLASLPDRETAEGERVAPGGNYATDLGLIAIRPRKEDLCACVNDEKMDMIPYPDGWFGVRPSAVDSLPPAMKMLGRLRFTTRRIDGREVIIAQKDGEEILIGEKMPPPRVPEVWRRRAGRYEVLNPDVDFPLEDARVWYQDGQLGMSYRAPLLSEAAIRVPLRPISETEAVILGLGRMRGETLRAVRVDGEELLRYSGYLGRKVSD